MIFWGTLESIMKLAVKIQIYQYIVNKSEVNEDYIK